MLGSSALPQVTSPRSPRISAARRLLKRAHRQETKLFLAEGPQAVREALLVPPAGPGGVQEMFVSEAAFGAHEQLVAQASQRGISVTKVTEQVLATLTQTVTPQGIVAVCRNLETSLSQVLVGGSGVSLVAVLASVRDPGNAGTVMRSADAAGAAAVVLADACVDPYNGKCVRASAGSLWHLPVVTGMSTGEVVSQLRQAGLQVFAADGQATHDVTQLQRAARLSAPTAWVFGNEAWGLPPGLRELADEVVRVPLYGKAESLNLASAATVCLYASAMAQHEGSQT